jgi:hypothetical protein
VSAAVPNRSEYIIDDDTDEDNDAAQSDMVRVALNLAYLTEEEAVNFSFNKNAFLQKMKKFSGAMFNNMMFSGMPTSPR